MRIGIFGGTFDPVHVGHIVVATTVHHALQLDETRVIVAADPWQKDPPPIAPAAERYAAVQAAIYDIDDPSMKDEDVFRFCRDEIVRCLDGGFDTLLAHLEE